MTQMRMVDDVFGEDIRNGLNPPTAIGNLPFGLNSYGPRQPNCFDCGVYVIRNMQYYGQPWAAKVYLDVFT